MRAALAVAAAILIPVAVICFFAWISVRGRAPCVCIDSDNCTCGGAWGAKR